MDIDRFLLIDEFSLILVNVYALFQVVVVNVIFDIFEVVFKVEIVKIILWASRSTFVFFHKLRKFSFLVIFLSCKHLSFLL